MASVLFEMLQCLLTFQFYWSTPFHGLTACIAGSFDDSERTLRADRISV